MIKNLSITNFKCIRAVENLPCESINVFIGPNGSGKSSLLQAIDFLRAFFETSVEVYLRDKEWHFGDLPNLRETHKKIRWEIEAELANPVSAGRDTFRYSVSLSPRLHLGVGEEQLEFRPDGTVTFKNLLNRSGRSITRWNNKVGEYEQFQEIGLPASIMSRLENRQREEFPELLRFREWIQRFQAFLLWDPKILRTPDRGKHDLLGSSGEHLAPYIGRLKRNKPNEFKKLIQRIKRFFPTVSDISVQGGKTWGWQSLRLHESNGRDVVFNSQQMSDGVLRLLAVTSLLYLDRPPSVVTFEEPENGVHPQLIREVVQVLKELTLRKPPNDCQVFFTTHSPYVLDEFFDHPEQVFLVERRRPQEGANVKKLNDLPQLKITRAAFEHSLGEAWVSGLLGANAGLRS